MPGGPRLCSPQRRAQPMRPSPSLHYVSTLLDQRRRRHHRARCLRGTGLMLLGLGLLLMGWWVTFRLSPSSTPQAAAVSSAGVPARPSGATGMRMISVEPHWERPVLLEPGACQDCACQTLSPWRTTCTPGDVVALGCPMLLWCTTAPVQRPRALTLSEPEPLPVQTGGALSDPTSPGLPAREDHPPEPLASPACEAAPCPAAYAVGRPESSHAQPPRSRRPRLLRPAGPQQPTPPVPPQRRVSDYAPPVLAEPERLTVSP
jgi:hypothetical protein